MSGAVASLLSQSLDQWRTVEELVEIGNQISRRARNRINSQVESAATQCLEVARSMTPDPPEREIARELEQTLARIASASDEGDEPTGSDSLSEHDVSAY